MAYSSERFRAAAFGGFNRQDVTSYIEKSSKEHNEELEKLKKQIESLTGERDSLAAHAAETESALSAERERTALLESEAKELSEEMEKLRAENSSATEKLSSAEEQIETLKDQLSLATTRSECAESECASLQAEIKQLNLEIAAYATEKQHVADIEIAAHERAKAIEDAAEKNANELHVKIAEFGRDASRKFFSVKEDTERTVSSLSSELEKIRLLLSGLPPYFEQLAENVSLLCAEDAGAIRKDISSKPEGAPEPERPFRG